MVTIRLEGGLANQLFQTAFLLAYVKKHGVDYCVPTTVNNPHIPGRGAYRLPGVIYHNDPPMLKEWVEPDFHYTSIPPMDNVCFVGYFQSWKYFDEYRDEILKAFDFKWEPIAGVVSLHYRAGDYKKWPDHHPVISEEYIERAIYYCAQRGYYNFLVFSDEIEAIREILSKPGRFPSIIKFDYSEGKNEIEDLIAVSSCEHNICSNSSYSWWAHYLNKNEKKMGIFPETWFGKALHHSTKDLYLPNAIIL